MFEAAGVTAVPDTEEEDVRAALTKVQLGEVDAALVYATDVRSAGDDVEGIDFPEAEEAVNDYPICVLADAPNPDGRAGLRRPGALRRGAAGARRRRLPRPTVVRPAATRRGVPAPARWSPPPLAVAFLVLPLVGLLVRAPWSAIGPSSSPRRGSVRRCGSRCSRRPLATAVSLVLGVPLAWVLARSRIRGRTVLRALVTVPLVLPPVVGGVALFLVLGRQGIVGRWLDDTFGITIPFTTTAVVIAETFVAMPFLVVSVEGALRAADARFEDVAATLGADRWTTFRRVTLPLVAPGVAAGAVLCWARALGEFGATITFAGNFPGTTQTMPTGGVPGAAARPRGRRSCSRWCCWPSRWPRSCCCATAGCGRAAP